MDLQNANKQECEAQLNERGAQTDTVKARLENVGVDIKDKLTGQIQNLPAQQHIASEKMKELGKASDEAWKSGQESDQAWGLEIASDAAEQVKAASDTACYGLKFRVADGHSKFK
jgi:hypothetical protein